MKGKYKLCPSDLRRNIIKIGLQSYSVRKRMTDNLEKTLEAVKKIGYPYLELYSRNLDDLKATMDKVGLSVPSVMFTLEELAGNLDPILSTCRTFQNNYAVCIFTPEQYRTDEGYLQVAHTLDRAAQKLSSHGITLAYHNHDFEFALLESGTCGFDILVAQTRLLTFELDVGWVQYAGLDPLAKMKELGKRISLLHLRDMHDTKDRQSCESELGSGVLDLPAIIKYADKGGIEFAFVEQGFNWVNDDAIESAEKSFNWLDASGLF